MVFHIWIVFLETFTSQEHWKKQVQPGPAPILEVPGFLLWDEIDKGVAAVTSLFGPWGCDWDPAKMNNVNKHEHFPACQSSTMFDPCLRVENKSHGVGETTWQFNQMDKNMVFAQRCLLREMKQNKKMNVLSYQAVHYGPKVGKNHDPKLRTCTEDKRSRYLPGLFLQETLRNTNMDRQNM